MSNRATQEGTLAAQAADPRALRIVAKSLYKELRAQGHSTGDILLFTSALLELATDDVAPTAEAAE